MLRPSVGRDLAGLPRGAGVAYALAAAGATAAALSLTLWPTTSWRVAVFAFAVITPSVLPFVMLVRRAQRSASSAGTPLATEAARARLTRVSITGAALALTLLGGFVLSNRWLTDEPLDPWTLAGYGVSLLLAGAVGALVWSASDRLTIAPRTLVSTSSLAAGSAALVLDSTVLVRAYEGAHLVLFGFGSASLAVAATLWVFAERSARRLHLALGLGAAALVAGVLVASDATYADAAVRSPTSPRRLLDGLRRLLDGDGDGHAAWLGGGDCDDHDARAYPLSPYGADCLGWRGHESLESPAPASVRRPSPSPEGAPLSVVLVTLESFRCTVGGFTDESRERSCPRIAQLGREGMLRWDAWTTYPATSGAIAALMTGKMDAGPTPSTRSSESPGWVEELARFGYETHLVLTTRRLLRHPMVRDGFSIIDDALVSRAGDPVAVTTHETTTATLAHLERAGDAPALVWAHYYDPHAPYVSAEGQHWSTNEQASYQAEVARVDEAVGDLAAALRALPQPERRLLIVTADHGEEFGEHGNGRHGATLYEGVLQVPILVWAPNGRASHYVKTPLPHGTAELGGLIRHAVLHEPYRPAAHAVASLQTAADPQVAVKRDGWKLVYHRRYHFTELFDLTADPEEARDVSKREPARVDALGALLGRALDR